MNVFDKIRNTCNSIFEVFNGKEETKVELNPKKNSTNLNENNDDI